MVRFANEADLPRVNELRKQVHELHANGRPDIFRTEFCQELRDHVYGFWRDENCDVIVAERCGVICGMASVEYLDRPESPYSKARKIYHVVEFGVDRSCQRQGVGRELMDFIKADAVDKGFERIELDFWAFNDTAEAFYESAGFHTFRKFMEWKLNEEN